MMMMMINVEMCHTPPPSLSLLGTCIVSGSVLASIISVFSVESSDEVLCKGQCVITLWLSG